MAKTASNHIARCNIGSCEAHNERTEEYMQHINPKSLYIIQERTACNQHWKAEQLKGMNLASYLDSLRQIYFAKHKQMPNEKDRKMVNKKTGKERVVAGWSPIREGVVNIKPTTTMDDLKQFGEICRVRFGITPIRIDIHKDEGHVVKYEPNVDDGEKTQLQNGDWVKLNLHAHIVYDWIDHDTAKTYKCDDKVMAEIQTLAAEILGMERGKKKAETGREHLEREEFIAQKLKEQKSALTEDVSNLEATKQAHSLQIENKKAELEAVTKEAETKKEEVNKIKADAFHQGIGAIGGWASDWITGKNAKKDKLIAAAQAENEQLTRALAEAKSAASTAEERAKAKFDNLFAVKLDSLQKSYDRQVEEAAKKKLSAFVNRINELDRQNESHVMSKSKLLSQLKSRENVLAILFKKLRDLVSPIVKAFVDLAKKEISIYSEFTIKQAKEIKDSLRQFSSNIAEQRNIGYWLLREAGKANSFSGAQSDQCKRELNRVVDNHYRLNQDGRKRIGY